MLRLLGRERAVAVEPVEGEHERVVDIARPERRRMRCPGCGHVGRAVYARSIRRRRHLDAPRTRVVPRAEVRRSDCPVCGVVAEQVPWARSGPRFARAVEDGCAFLARDAPETLVAGSCASAGRRVGRMTLAAAPVDLGPERRRALEAVSVDLRGAWPEAIGTMAPRAAICATPSNRLATAGA